ncbi:MAG TPA: hypothetical protein P5121_14525 [Caldilineaceae bacterium]|nr:hypothetical protein [Caldilineaceae bacterium]
MSAQPTVVLTHLIQLRCEADDDALWRRYQDRILKGERHPGHIDGSADATLRARLFARPPGWIGRYAENCVNFHLSSGPIRDLHNSCDTAMDYGGE